MSWIKTVVKAAVDKDNLRRTVQSYADSVVVHAGNAVASGARILQDRIPGFRNLQGFKHTVKRLEEVSVSCRGIERVQLLRRWLVSLKEVENKRSSSKLLAEHPGFDESEDSPRTRTPTLVLYVDSPGDDPKNFRDAFLYSQALEGITMSMILEAPNEEEASLVLEIYGLCLTGGKEVHGAVVRKVQGLAEAFLGYREEVLIKREELLQFAQAAIAGLKVNADLARIDSEACRVKERLDRREEESDLEQAFAEIQLCYDLEAILLRKKSLSNGDSPEIHAEKLYKLKILLESLANSTSKAEKRVLDNRSQKEEALSYRVAKTDEVHQAEKDLVAEVRKLETKRDELEDELKKVNASLVSTRKRLNHVREERDQLDEASNHILLHLKSKEDELLRSIASSRAEAGVVDTWIHFLQDTWLLQTANSEQNEKQVMGELERLGDYFVNLVIQLLSAYKDNLVTLIVRTREVVESLKRIQRSKILVSEEDKPSKATKPRKYLEEEYLHIEAKFLTTMSVVDTMEKQFYDPTGTFRKDEQKIKELFEAIEKLREEFELIERPILEIETPTKKSDPPFNDQVIHSSSDAKKKTIGGPEPQLTELYSELDKDSPIGSPGDIYDWEFDALDQKL